MKDVIIIGGGIGGSAAALRAAQNGMKAVWILGSKFTRKRSRSQWVVNLDNIIGFHEDIIKDQVQKTLRNGGFPDAAALVESEHYHINNRAIIRNTLERIKEGYPDLEIIEEEVLSLIRASSGFEVSTSSQSFSGVAVVLATGVMDQQPYLRKKGKSGRVEESPKWIYPFANREQVLYCIRCEGHLTKDDTVAVLGHTDVAAELAMMLHERYGIKVYVLTNGEKPVISENRKKILEKYSIVVIPTLIANFLGDGVKQLRGFVFENGDSVEVKFALVSLGLNRVYNDLARQVSARLMDQNQTEEKRHIWIDYKGETSVENLFVVGDAAKRDDEPVMKQVYTAQEYAVRAVDTIDSRRRKRMREIVLKKN
ncbi:MAG: NAD(P)/FAD-dependent oxidoreductase [Fidelibacterota bacterium]